MQVVTPAPKETQGPMGAGAQTVPDAAGATIKAVLM
jgi:hypothetical protein